MANGQYNPKSDVPAKLAFVEHLLKDRSFDEARVTRHPADVTAIKCKQIFYFEIKYTAQVTTYFGAATLTEWEAALAYESNFWFRYCKHERRQMGFPGIHSVRIYVL
jgi:hypothetical protein